MSEGTISWRGGLSLGLVFVVGIAAFSWPFVASSATALEHGHDLPWLFAVLLGLLGLLVLAELSGGGLTATEVAILGALAAMGGALRVLSAGAAGLEPIFALLVLGGRVLSARLAFLMGSLALLVGALLTGGVGPWVPFQMIACGFVSLGAAALPRLRGRAEILLLAGYGLVAGIGYGIVMNLWFWPFAATSSVDGGAFVIGGGALENLAHYAVFYLGTSLGWDLGRGVLTAALVVLGGRRVLGSLRRVVRRAVFAGAAV